MGGMSVYIDTIKFGIVVFPIIAALITLPYLLWHYHRYGALPFVRVLIVYSFVLYLLIAYFLVILPLPSRSEVMYITTPTKQLEVFHFIDGLKQGVAEVGYRQLYKTPVFYTTFLNVCLTIPFGAYLKFYFKKGFFTTIFYTFLLSLFFELTQLTGLYFIYPRPYRLFDVDDLIVNTLGAIPGFILGWFISFIMPNIHQVNDAAFVKGRHVSLLRRFVSFCLDGFIVLSFSLALSRIFPIDWKIILAVMVFIYYFVIPCSEGQTIANMILNIRIVEEEGNFMHLKTMLIRQVLFFVEIILIPLVLSGMVVWKLKGVEGKFAIILMLLFLFALFIYYLIIAVKMTFQKPLFYDKVSHSMMVSTIKKRNSKSLQAVLDNVKQTD